MGNKIWLISRREYLTRVRKKSFIIMSILGPLLIAAFYGVIFWSAMSTGGVQKVQIVDDSGYFQGKFDSNAQLSFYYTSLGLGEARSLLSEDRDFDALLYIPPFSLENPSGFMLFSSHGIPSVLEANLRKTLEKEIEALRLQQMGIDHKVLEDIKVRIDIDTHVEQGEGAAALLKDSTASSIMGLLGGLIIYLFIFIYGVQVMRGVIEEKTNRIVEIMISSVKPFELMMGKILGIAAVGLTQLGIWLVLGNIIGGAVAAIVGMDELSTLSIQSNSLGGQSALPDHALEEVLTGFGTIDFPLILGAFLFYFLFGYLMYASLFASIGAAVDSETDTQQFMFPVTLPLILSIALVGNLLTDPFGNMAVGLSIFPLTAPVAMMIRLPFIGWSWELLLSMALLFASFIGTTWLAGRIYRVGILLYGKKTSYKELYRWLFLKRW